MEQSQSKKSLTFLAILALAGVGFGIQLTQHYYEVRSGMAGFHSFCNISSTMNCDVVAASPYSELFAGLPLSSFATGWYLALFIVALIARGRFWRREAVRFAAVMTGFGLLMGLAYFLVMALKLHTYCLFCLMLDATGLLAAITVFLMKPEGLAVQKPEFSKWKSLSGVLLACLVVSVLALKGLDNVSITSAEIDDNIESILSSPVLPMEVAGFPGFGPENAPIQIAEYSDFQCPYCRLGAMVLNSLLDRYPSQVRVVFKPFPLDQSCNRMMTEPLHLTACEAARVALCSQKQGKFKAVYETLFENQTEILPGVPAKLAEKQGVDVAQLTACSSATEVPQQILKSVEDGIQLGVKSTPTFLINGHKVEGLLPGPFWTRLVDRLLRSSAPNAH
jgi:protein-disulfide isomerase/uncharacterized membrane protein